MVEVLGVLSPDTTTIPVNRFLGRELARFLVLLPLSFRFPDYEYDRITWKSRIMKSGEMECLWEINYL